MTAVDTTLRVGDVREQMETADGEWWEYHNLVRKEVYGQAPSGTAEMLAADPFRWAAHLGVAIGTVANEQRLRQRRHRSALAALVYLRARLEARRGDVIALRKRTLVEIERDQARDALAQILTLIDSPTSSNADVLTIRQIALDAIGDDE